MSNTLVGILGFTAFFVMILSGLADIVLAATWTKTYFASGVLVFMRHVPVEAPHNNIPSSSLLDESLSWMGAFTFKELGVDRYGFRRKFFSFAPQPIMHGLVIFDAENKRITVKGYLDWFMISLSIMLLILVPLMLVVEQVSFAETPPRLAVGFIAFFTLILGILYAIDYDRLTKFGIAAAKLWSKNISRVNNRA